MLPTVAIVGAPNVGKSTLFNQLTCSRDALVIDLPGTTRDRKYGYGKIGDVPYILVDTGGISEANIFEQAMAEQAWIAAEQADVILFVVDGKTGVGNVDIKIANQLRRLNKQIWVVVNKTDGVDIDVSIGEFYALGFTDLIPIAAKAGRGIAKLANQFLQKLSGLNTFSSDIAIKNRGIKVAIVGQPNVGKSTLINRILGEERLLVSDEAGTTRDSIFIPFERDNRQYTLIDTAGVRRKAKVKQKIEKFSVVKTLQTVEASQVVLFLMDARRGIVTQDISLLQFIIESGKALVVVINKWDGLAKEQRMQIKKSLEYRLQFVDFAEQHFISALHGTGVGNLFNSVDQAYQNSMKVLNTNNLTKLLEKIISKHQPPLVQGRRIKLRYAHAGGHNPPRIIIHGNQTEHIPHSYKRY